MKSGLISIVIPVYNGEKYIQRCISSLVSQTYSDIEIIIVDDGSTDGTMPLCKQFAENDKRVIVLHQKNAGVSAARNLGIQKAEGEFIAFVDADDWVAIDMFEKMHNAILADETAEIAVCGYFEVTSANIVSKPPFAKKAISKKEVLMQNTPAFSWGKLFKYTLKGHLNYPVGVSMGEDTATIIPAFSYAQNFVAIDEPLYYYFQNGESVTHGISNTKKMFSYVVGCYNALKNSNPDFVEDVAISIADRIVSNEGWFLKTCLADTMEYVAANMMPFFENNTVIKRSPRLSKILTYPNVKVIPKYIYYDRFGCGEVDAVEKACLESWKEHASNMTIICLDESNCDIKTAPQYVVDEYNKGNPNEIGNYFKLKKIVETGGVAMDRNMYLNCGLGYLRLDNAVFALKNRYDFQDGFFAAQQGSEVMETLLASYNSDGIYADQSIPFLDRVKELLLERYGYAAAGWTMKLKNGEVTIYKCDVLSYNITKNNVAQILNEDQLKFLNTEYVLTERSVFDYWEEDKNFLWADREKLKKMLANGKQNEPVASPSNRDQYVRSLELELMSMRNSRSWRITAPLRKIMSIFRRRRTK